MRAAGCAILVAAVTLIPFAWWPALPLHGGQLSDVVGVLGVALVLASTRRFAPSRLGAAAAIAYALCALLSFAVAGGSAVRMLGYAWLVALGLATAIAADDDTTATHIRRALLAAAVIGAVVGLTGAILFFAGKSTGLLNMAGDLVPGNYPRIRGTMLRANALAGLLSLGLVLLADVPRRFRAHVGTLLALALVFTFSRSLIAVTAAGAVYALALRPHPTRPRDALAILVVLAAVALMLAVSWLDVKLDPTHPWRIHTTGDVGTRWMHLNDAIDVIRDHPLGRGPGRDATNTGWDAHFALANIAGTIGIPAALAFLALFVIALVRTVRAARAGHAAARGIAAALVLFAIDALARDLEDQRVVWVVAGLALVVRRPRETETSTA